MYPYLLVYLRSIYTVCVHKGLLAMGMERVMKFMKKEKKNIFSPTLDPCKTAVQKCKGIVLALVMT